MRCSFNYYNFILLYMYTKLWPNCIIYSHANKAILNWIERDRERCFIFFKKSVLSYAH